VRKEPLSVRERMSRVLMRVSEGPAGLLDLLDPTEGRAGIIVTVLAILEMTRSGMITVQQEGPFAPLTVQQAAASDAAALPIESEYD
jgi:segregation and condensation protein A